MTDENPVDAGTGPDAVPAHPHPFLAHVARPAEVPPVAEPWVAQLPEDAPYVESDPVPEQAPLPESPDAPVVAQPVPAVVEPAVVEPALVEAAVVEPVGPVTPVVPGRRHARSHSRSFLSELPVLVIIAFVLALLIKHFLVQAFYIPSGSMEQTLMVGDRVLVNKVPYTYRGPHRGEIVVFNGLDNFAEGVTFAQPTNPVSKALRAISNTIGFGAPSEKDYIKRVIGVPGDRVMCCDDNGNVVVTPKGGKATSLIEPYVFENDMSGTRYFCQAVVDGKPPSKQTCPAGAEGILVPEDRLWVMGDHRGNSSDSRFHLSDHQGTVPEDKVVGRAFSVVYPFGRFGLLHVPDAFSTVALPASPYVLGAVGTLPIALLRRRRRLR